MRRQKVLARLIGTAQSRVEIDRGGQVLIVDLGEPRGASRRIDRLGGDREKRLADEEDMALGKDRIVAEDRRIVVLPRDVLGGQDENDARRRAHRRKIHRPNAGMGPFALREIDLQRARQIRLIVRITRETGDMFETAVMGKLLTNAAPDRAFVSGRAFVKLGDRRLAGRPTILNARFVHQIAPARSRAASGPAMRPVTEPDDSS